MNHVQAFSRMKRDKPCTDLSVQCTYHAHTCIYKLKGIFHALSFVQTRYIHVHSVFASEIVYILVQTLFIQCTYQVYTLNVQVQVFMCIEYKNKKLLVCGFELTTLCRPQSCLNHCASSVGVIGAIVLVYIYVLLYRTSVGRGTSRPPRPRHDVAWPSLNLDLEIDSDGEAGPGPGSLGGADVAAVLRPDEQGGRASNLKGGWLLCR
jgi:hypothetical protein